MIVEVIVAWTRVVVGYRTGRTAGPAVPAGPAAPASSAAPARCGLVTPFLSPNVYLQVKIPTQLVELY
jgi:hypothetical protein